MMRTPQPIKDFEGKKILIVGDIGLDQYISGPVKRISPEAPVPIVEATFEENRLGLAANVAQNVVALGGIPILVSVTGFDAAGDDLRGLLVQSNISTKRIARDESRSTTRKIRIMSQDHHIVRVDYGDIGPLTHKMTDYLLEKIMPLKNEIDAIIVQDYGKGVISKRVVQELKKLNKPILVDPNGSSPLDWYEDVDLIKPNYEEAHKLINGQTDKHLPACVGLELQEKSQIKNVVMTCGKFGMWLFSGQGSVHFPTNIQKVFDVTGAGDTVIAVLALGWAAGMDLGSSCVLANHAAGVVVGKVGSATCNVNELLNCLELEKQKELKNVTFR